MRLFRRFIPLMLIGGLTLTSLESCRLFSKNKCDSCPHGDGSKPKKMKKHR